MIWRPLLPLLACCALAAGEPAVPVDLPIRKDDPAWGCAKAVPIYMQEWHIWWGFPYPDVRRQPSHLTTAMTAFLEPWRLSWDRNGYPLVGIYDSDNAEIIRWQARCMKAAGITSAAVMIHPATADGLMFVQEGTDALTRLLDAVALEGFPVFFMDEVAFMNGRARDPEAMTQRVIRFLKRYGRHPGFYRIDGKPVYYYQTFGFWIGEEATRKMMAEVEKEAGPVHWMVFGDVAQLAPIAPIASIVCGASVNMQSPVTRRWDWDVAGQDPKQLNPVAHAAGKRISDLHHIKYENTAQPWRTPGVSHYGHRGDRLKRVVLNSLAAKADFLMLSSWNDYEEGTYAEPSWDFDGFTGDPYLYCRVIAALRGIDFAIPAPPPMSAVHPSIWEKLGYGDGAGPMIERVRRSHQRGGSIEVVVRDTASAVTDLEVCWGGDWSWTAPRPGASATATDAATLQPPAGALGPPEILRSPIHARLQIGAACPVLDRRSIFAAVAGAPDLGPTPAVGVIYALDQANPMGGAEAELALATPFVLDAQAGRTQPSVRLPLGPHNVPEDVGQDTWEGWHCRVALPPAPVALTGKAAQVVLEAQGRKLAHLSLLGPPRPERIAAVPRQDLDGTDRRIAFYVPIDIARLETPGLHALWLRARDQAGNWGPPRLAAVPNYEFINESAKTVATVDADWRKATGAVLATRFNSNETAFQQVYPERGGIGRGQVKQVVTDGYLSVSNAMLFFPLSAPVKGAFRLEWKMLHAKAQRATMIWLTDTSGGKGYGVLWHHPGENLFQGQGEVALLKLDQAQAVSWQDGGTRLGKSVASGRPATRQPLAEFRLERSAEGHLTLSVDGQVRLQADDTAFDTFERLYLRGNDAQIFDDVLLVAAPATAAAAR